MRRLLFPARRCQRRGPPSTVWATPRATLAAGAKIRCIQTSHRCLLTRLCISSTSAKYIAYAYLLKLLLNRMASDAGTSWQS